MTDPVFKKPVVAKWDGSRNPLTFVPEPRLEVMCQRCCTYSVYAGYTVIDAERDMWRDRYERLNGMVNEAIRISHLKYGTDPMYEEFMTVMMRIRDQLGDQ